MYLILYLFACLSSVSLKSSIRIWCSCLQSLCMEEVSMITCIRTIMYWSSLNCWSLRLMFAKEWSICIKTTSFIGIWRQQICSWIRKTYEFLFWLIEVRSYCCGPRKHKLFKNVNHILMLLIILLLPFCLAAIEEFAFQSFLV